MAEQYYALYDYQASDESGLTFRQGETIWVHEKGNTGWWNGETQTSRGWFPESYVQKLESLPPGWQALRDEQGRTYYYHDQTKTTSWTLPTNQVNQVSQPNPTTFSSSASSDNLLRQANEPQTEGEGRVFIKDPNGRINYTDNFWTDTQTGSGFDVLVQKHRNGKEVMKDIAEWMRERSVLEEKYAKDLMKLAKSNLGDIEDGTMKTAWYQVKFDLENQARFRQNVSQAIIDRVDKALLDFKDKQKKARKDFEVTIAKDRKAVTLKEQEVAKVKKIYDQTMKDAEASELDISKGQLPNQTKAQFSKLEDKAKSDRKKATQAAIDYKKMIDEYSKTRQQWEDDMSLACLDFSEAEEERVSYLKGVLEAYLDIEQQIRDKLQESGQMVRNSVQAVNAEVDIEMFVKTKGTGSRKPPLLIFEQYNSKKP